MKSNKSVYIFSLFGLLIASVCWLAAYYTKGVIHKNFQFISELIIFIVCLRFLVWIYHLVQSKKIGKRMFLWLKNKVIKNIEKANRAINRFTLRHGSRLHLYQDHVEFLANSDNPHKLRSFHRLKWKDMHTDSEKVRYIYIMYIRRAIRMGFRFRQTQTPKEINSLLSHIDDLSNEQLFSLYNLARYAKENDITPCDVQNLIVSTESFIGKHIY